MRGVDAAGDAADRVLDDPDARAREVVAAADGPDQLAVASDGTIVTHYTISDDEGGDARKEAVRVRYSSGDVVEHLVGSLTSVAAADDDVLTHTEGGAVRVLRRDGSVDRITRGATDDDGRVRIEGIRPADGIEADDVLVGLDRGLLYRPRTETVHRAPTPEHDPGIVPTLAVSEGQGWFMTGEDGAPLMTSVGGRSWRVAPDVPSGPSVGLVARGDRAAVAIGRVSGMDLVAERFLVVEQSGDPRIVPAPAEVVEPEGVWTTNGDLLVGDSSEGWWRLAGSDWRPVDVPGPVWRIVAAGPALYALGEGKDVWVSEDDGTSWSSLRV